MADPVGTTAAALGITFLVCAMVSRRSGDAARDTRLLLGTGAALGGLSLALLGLGGAA